MATPELQETLKQQIDEAFDKIERLYQAEIDALNAKVAELEAKLRLQTDAEMDARIREITAHQRTSIEAWIKDAIEQKIAYGDMPMIRVQTDFYERLMAHALAKGITPESLMTSEDATQYLMSLIDNLLI